MTSSQQILSGIPDGLRSPLFQTYQEIASNYIEHKWEPSELNGGKFCEVVYTILDGSIKGTFPNKPSKPKNMVTACRGLENSGADPSRVGDASIRILIPKMLLPLYEIRNKRGVGHVGGDINPNFLDATAVYSMASWVLAELIRIFHGITTAEAQEIVDTIIERKLPLVWEVGDVRRVLDTSMSAKDQTLVLLFGKPSWVDEKDLCASVEYSNQTMFKKRVLNLLHGERKIEYDKANRRAHISPLGSKDVEERILKDKLASL